MKFFALDGSPLFQYHAFQIPPPSGASSSNYKTVVGARVKGGQSALLIHVPVKKHNWGAFINPSGAGLCPVAHRY